MISTSCSEFATTHEPSSHPPQFNPSDPISAVPHALERSPDRAPPSSLSGTTGSNIEVVRHTALNRNTADPVQDVHVVQPLNPASNDFDLSLSMSSLFTNSRSPSSTSSITLQFSSDNNDSDEYGNSNGSPVIFAVPDLDTDSCDETDLSTERSPLIFARPDLDYDDDDLEFGIVYRRRVSWPTSASVGDAIGEEKKSVPPRALRRQSRSLDNMNLKDISTADDSGQLLFKTNWESKVQARRDAGEEPFGHNELDVSYILSDYRNSKRSSVALSYVQQVPKLQETGYLLSIRRKLGGVAKSPSSPGANTGANEDTFMKILEQWDTDYDARKDYWTIKRQDGADIHDRNTTSGPHSGSTKLGLNDSLGRMSLGKAKGKDKLVESRGMAPGTEEIWECGFMGMFKVERVSYTSGSSKPPHQRLNLRRITDDTRGGTREGPNMVIHKHSRVIAFSIIRAYSFGKSEKLGNGILLAPRKVQQHFTATRNTSKLVTHGLLESNDALQLKDHGRKGKKPADKSDGPPKDSKSNLGETEHGEIYILRDSIDRIPLSLEFATNVPLEVAESEPPPESLIIPATVSQTQTGISLESVSDHSTTQSLHAYERPPLQRRNSSGFSPSHRDPHLTRADTHPSSFFKRWLRPPSRPSSSHKPVSPGGDFKAPWLTMGKQEETERAIEELNEAFKGVGLVHINTKPTVNPKKGHSEADKSPGVLGQLSKDTLYMFLPLWPAETRTHSAVPVLEDRCYLLIYYVPFAGQPKKSKKRSPISPMDSARMADERNILLSEFRVCACVVNYAELRGSGVRLPSDGLLISNPTGEERPYLQKLDYSINEPHGLVIGMYHGKERCVEFVPEGILKLGFCLEPSRSATSLLPSELEKPRLSGLGRAVVEMVWAGCMALSSFGST